MAKRRKTTTKSKRSTKRGNLFTKYIGNIKNNVKDPFPKKLMFTALGAAMYPLIPWVLKSWFKTDMDGWKTVVAGAFFPTVIGLAINKPEMAMAGIACGTTHLIMGVGTGTIQNMLGVAPPRFDKSGTPLLADAPSAPMIAPAGFKYIALPDGEQVLVPERNFQPALPALNDYLTPEQLTAQAPNQTVTEFVDTVANTDASKPQLSAYVSELSDEKQGGMAFRQFQQAVSRGNFKR